MSNLEIEIGKAFIKGKFYITTSRANSLSDRSTHALTIKELEQVRDEICDFLAEHHKKEQAS